jgi:hypothetical protein
VSLPSLVALLALGAAAAAALAVPAQATLSATTASATGTNFRIVVASDDGSGRRMLTSGKWSSVSPDGAQVAVVDYDLRRFQNARLWKLKLFASDGRAATRTFTTPCGGIFWSPDSTKFACATLDPRGRGARTQLLLFDALSGRQTTLASGFFGRQLSFSPDSTQLAFVQRAADNLFAKGTLKRVELATGQVTTISDRNATDPAWGPTAIAFSVVRPVPRHNLYDVALIQPDGSGFRQLTRFRPTRDFFGPHPVAWSADGSRLLGGVYGLDAWTYRLAYAIDPVSGRIRRIAEIAPSAISRDGRYVIGATGDAESSGIPRSNIVRVPWEGGAARVLIRGAIEASFSG